MAMIKIWKLHLAVLTAAMLLLPSCREGFNGSVRFSASTDASVRTRTAYSGVIDNGKERIDWLIGDRIRIGCVYSGDSFAAADYGVSRVSSSGVVSSAELAVAEGNGLYWGDESHDFIALSPSPSTPVPGASDSKTLADSLGVAVAGPAVSAFIPSVQEMDWEGLTGSPRMEYALLVAATMGIGRSSSVRLVFRPAFNAVRLVFGYEKDSPLCIRSLSVSGRQTASAADGAVSGPYSVELHSSTVSTSELTASATVTLPSSADEPNRVVTVPMDGDGKTMHNGDFLTLTVFLLPADYSALSFVLDTDKGLKTLKMRSNDGGTLFPACGKTVVTGFVIPNDPYITFTSASGMLDGMLSPWSSDGDEFLLELDGVI